MIKFLSALRTPFLSLSHMQARQAAVCRLSQFHFTQIYRFTLPTRPCFSCPIEPDPSDDPNLFDISISDIDSQTLSGDISKALGHKYLESITLKIHQTSTWNLRNFILDVIIDFSFVLSPHSMGIPITCIFSSRLAPRIRIWLMM